MVEWGGRKRMEKLWKYYSWWSSVRQWYTGSVSTLCWDITGLAVLMPSWPAHLGPGLLVTGGQNKAISSQTSPTCVLSHQQYYRSTDEEMKEMPCSGGTLSHGIVQLYSPLMSVRRIRYNCRASTDTWFIPQPGQIQPTAFIWLLLTPMVL